MKYQNRLTAYLILQWTDYKTLLT